MTADEPYVPEYELEPVTFHLPQNRSSSNSHDSSTTFLVWTVCPPPLEYLSTLYNHHVEISGRKLWCGSILLTQFLIATYYDTPYFYHHRILELGSGSGIVGMALAFSSLRYPPSCLVLTDGEDASVELMHQNIQQNDALLSTNAHCIHATAMTWGNQGQDLLFQDDCHDRFPTVFPHTADIEFDCILAGDVLYKQELPCLFFQTVQSYLSKRGGVLFLCHVPRANVTHDFVMGVAHEYGFIVEKVDHDNIPLPQACPLEDAQRACIYKMTLSTQSTHS